MKKSKQMLTLPLDCNLNFTLAFNDKVYTSKLYAKETFVPTTKTYCTQCTVVKTN